MNTTPSMVECEKCGVFNDPTRRDVCWKCNTALPKQQRLPEVETKK